MLNCIKKAIANHSLGCNSLDLLQTYNLLHKPFRFLPIVAGILVVDNVDELIDVGDCMASLQFFGAPLLA